MRKQGWPEILAAEIEAHRNRPFEWGVHDCALFAADVVQAMTDVDYSGKFRGRYSTEAEANELLERMGGLEAIATDALGEPLDNPRFAQRGDVILINNDRCFPRGMEALGICIGHKCAYVGKKGLIFLSMKDWQKAWRVR